MFLVNGLNLETQVMLLNAAYRIKTLAGFSICGLFRVPSLD